MGIKRLDEQIERLEKKLNGAMLIPNSIHIGMAKAEFLKLKFMLNGLSSFVEHRWEVRLFTKESHVDIKISAEHLVEARDVAIELGDVFPEVVRYELYCDGIVIPEEN